MTDRVAAILAELRENGSDENVEGMERFGIRSARMLGVPKPVLHQMARRLRRDHELALALWETGILDARILAALIDDPRQVTEPQMESWVLDVDSWDLCDQVTGKLFDRTPVAWRKAVEWSARDEEFVRRAGFAMMAWLSTHDKKAGDERFEPFFDACALVDDNRNFVRKAVSWALRNMGKRNLALNARAVATADTLLQRDTAAARWIARDVLRELTAEKTLARLRERAVRSSR